MKISQGRKKTYKLVFLIGKTFSQPAYTNYETATTQKLIKRSKYKDISQKFMRNEEKSLHIINNIKDQSTKLKLKKLELNFDQVLHKIF